jgi:hypothetical protein
VLVPLASDSRILSKTTGITTGINSVSFETNGINSACSETNGINSACSETNGI